jgi:GH18 family chitinase
VKLLISFGGAVGDSYKNFEIISSNSTLREIFVKNVLDFIQTNGIHGGMKFSEIYKMFIRFFRRLKFF